MTGAVLGRLIRDVFRRARASGFQAALLAGSLLTAVVSASIDWEESTQTLGLLGGRWLVGSASSLQEAVRNYLFMLAFGVADVIGVLVTLVATAAFLPTFLEPAAATVMFSKPPSRSTLFLGRCVGVIVFVAVNAGIFVAANGVAVGAATGIWERGYWLCWPLLIVQFIAFFGFSALIAVTTRNAVAAMLGAVFFWLISWGMSWGRHFLAGIRVENTSAEFGRVVNYAYHVLPKPTDFTLMLHEAMGVKPDGLANVGLRTVQEAGLYSPGWAVVSSLLAGIILLALSAYELEHQDY